MNTDLRCSPQKTQLLILPPPERFRKAASQAVAENIMVRTDDAVPIPHVSGLRIMGMFVDGIQTNTTTVKNIVTKIRIATHLGKWVSTRYQGMNERGLLRLLQVFVVSQAAYAGAFRRWTRAEDKIDAAIRKAYRNALGLLPGTRTSALLALGVLDKPSEISEAQRTAQLARLNSTKTDRSTLKRVGINPPAHGCAEDDELESQVPLRDGAARGIIVFPSPKNVKLEDWERRKVRAAALAKQYKSDENVVFVDVTKHPSRRCVYAMAVIRESTDELINAGTIKAKTP